MRKIYTIGLALLAVLAFSAVAAATASAEGGPEWIVVLCEKVPANTGLWLLRDANGKCLEHDSSPEGEWETKLMKLVTGETEKLTSEGGIFILDGTTNIECLKEEDTGEIIGGNPGTDLSTIEFFRMSCSRQRNMLSGQCCSRYSISGSEVGACLSACESG